MPEIKEALEFTYRNWRGEISRRRVVPITVRWDSTEWHPEPQWLLQAYDLDRTAIRDFAMKDMVLGQAEDLKGWTRHEPGNMDHMSRLPPPSTLVEVKARDGSVSRSVVGDFDWKEWAEPDKHMEIIAWRIVE